MTRHCKDTKKKNVFQADKIHTLSTTNKINEEPNEEPFL